VARCLVDRTWGDLELFFETLRVLEASWLERPASPPNCLGRTLAALSAVDARQGVSQGHNSGILGQTQLLQEVSSCLKGKLDADALLSAMATERKQLEEWLSTSPLLLPSFTEWLEKHWLRFRVMTHGQFSDFELVLRQVSETIASTVASTAASCGERTPHTVVLGAFCVTLLSSGILAAEALLQPGRELRVWKQELLAVHMANAEIGYFQEPLPATHSMLLLLLMTGCTIQQLQYAAGRVVEDLLVLAAANSVDVAGFDSVTTIL
jgi:hypothetical protein